MNHLILIDSRIANAFGNRLPRVLSTLLIITLSVVALQIASPLWAGEPATPEESKIAEGAEGQTVQEIDIRGLSRVDEGTLLRLIRTRKGRPLDGKTWAEDWRRLEQSGYFLDVRTSEPIIWPGGVKLVIDLIEKASISKVEFRSNKSVSASKLLGVIKSYEGGRYDKGQVHLDKVAI
ncbi:MAG: POTRA domain-containing protein, partial [Planctomycetota bacterium]